MMSGGELLVGAVGVGATLIGLYALDARGVITVNTKAVRGLIVAGGLYVGWRLMALLHTFM